MTTGKLKAVKDSREYEDRGDVSGGDVEYDKSKSIPELEAVTKEEKR